MTIKLSNAEKENLLSVLPLAYKDCLESQDTVYIMLDSMARRTSKSIRVCWGKAPQAGYFILGVMNYCANKATAFLHWPLIDSSYPVYSEYIGKLQSSVPIEVW
jgi:hypothetical protein